MKLSQLAIDEFKQIFQTEYGVVLSNEEATEKAAHLLNLFKVFGSPHQQFDVAGRKK